MVGFSKKIGIALSKNLDTLTRSYIYMELVPFFQCCDLECPSSLYFTQILRTSQGYASMCQLSGRNVAQ